MTQTMVPQAPAQPLRRLLDALRPPAAADSQEHLHYDRGAREWKTHAELGRPASPGWAAPDVDLVGCA